MFRVEDPGALAQLTDRLEKDYVIGTSDVLQLEVYTNAGEQLIDGAVAISTDGTAATEREPRQYTVDVNGLVRFPLLGDLRVEGLTIRQAEEMVSKAYAGFYKEPFVVLSFASKRAFVLGAVPGQVVPLTYPNMKLTEVLARAGGIGDDSNAENIRVLRGEQIFVADLSTIQHYVRNDMVIQPGDVIYIEPVRRPFTEGLQDYGPLISMLTSLGTLIIVILRLTP